MKKILLVLAVLCLAGSAYALQSWDVTADYVPNVLPAAGIGPEGAWSYGYNGGGYYNKLEDPFHFHAFREYGPWHWELGYQDTAWWNGNQLPGLTVNSGQFAIHTPQNDTEPVIIRWTSSRDMIVNLTGAIWQTFGNYPEARDHFFGIRHNNATLLSGTAGNDNSASNKVFFSASGVAVNAGDVLDFYLVRQPNNTDGFYTLDLKINETPEPGSLVTLGFGVLGLVGFSRRRRV